MKKTIMEDMTTLMADVLANFLNGSKVFEMEMGILKERLEKSFSETLEEDNNVSYIVEILQRTTMGETIPRELVDILHVEGSCPICLQDLEAGKKVRCMMQCNHQFHKHCIDKWLVLNKSCPICRRSINMYTLFI
ncbi:NEP1-interacting protein-like 1 [Chenopodium quinoa]|uniref:NEP1-interacting protein-like 1 n=1 Tax=Chenopodium quinoa TaxID=63459 RepID=UPI000B76D9F2|nr:NEP1-interacting protein-like 1 [Chenopodium quinoa]